MSRARRYRIVSILAVVMAGGFVALTACSNYSEGDRCETKNNNDDCVDGLQCTPKAQLVPPYNSSDRCCPPDLATSKHPACALPQTGVGVDATPPPDTGPVPDATPVDAAEASTPEAGPDSSGSTDAADEGG